MRTRTMMLKTSMIMAALPLLLVGCGDLTEGGPSASPGSIGKLMLVADAPALQGEPVMVTKRVVPTAGTGTIGAVTVTYYDLDRSICDSMLPEVAINCPTAPDAVTIGPDGAPWYASNGSLARVAEDDTVTRLPRFQGAGYIAGLAAGGGALWGLSWGDHQGVLRYEPATSAADFYTVPAPLSRPTAAIVDGHGDLFVTGGDSAVVGRIDAHRNVYVVAQEAGAAPITVVSDGVAIAADGAVYLSDLSAGRIGRVNGSGFTWTDLGGSAHGPSGIAAAPDGSVWFVDLGIPSQAGRIDPAGNLQTFPLPDVLQHHGSVVKSGTSLAVAPDGSAWFTVLEADAVVRVTASGDISYVPLEPASLPRGVAVDSAGRIWITTFGFARIDLGS